MPGAEAARRVRTARELVRLPGLARAHAAGEVPTEHVRAAVNVARNPRIDQFINEATDAFFTEEARLRSHESFTRLLRQWERLADQDGAGDGSDRRHDARRARLIEEFDSGFRLEGRWGALQGAILQQILARFEDAEFEADWAEAKAMYGDDARVEHLARTPAQRRADAVLAIFRRADSVDADDVVESEPLVNVMVDQETFERAMAMAAGEDVGDDDPSRADRVWCHTDTGVRLDLLDIAECAIVGHVRRVVYDSRNVVIDLGRRERLFKRGAREAVLLGRWPGQDPGCGWADCGVPDRWSQIDHVNDWGLGGPTAPWNGLPRCGYHNRLKNTGFRTVRDEQGRQTHLRPDGQLITAPV